jgi:hypothetical protein
MSHVTNVYATPTQNIVITKLLFDRLTPLLLKKGTVRCIRLKTADGFQNVLVLFNWG